MSVTPGFLQTIVSYVRQDSTTESSLIVCLKFIADTLGLSTQPEVFDKLVTVSLDDSHKFKESLGILLTKLNKPTIKQLSGSHFPLLIQATNGNLSVFIRQKNNKFYVFDATTNQSIILTDAELSTRLDQVWQCSPVTTDLPTNLTHTLSYLVKNFTPQLLGILFAGFILSLFNSGITAVVSYFIANIGLTNQFWLAANNIPILLFFLVMAMLMYLNGLLQNSLTMRATTGALPALWNQLLTQPLQVMRNIASGDVTQRVADYEIALNSIIPILITTFFHTLTLIFIFLYMAYFNGWLAISYVLIGFAFLAIKLLIIPLNVKHIQAQFATQGKAAGLLNETFLQIHKIRSSQAEKTIFKKWLSHWVELKTQTEKIVKLATLLSILEIAMPLGLLLLFYRLVYVSPHQQHGYWLQFMICATQFTSIFDKFSAQLLALLDYTPALQRVETLLSPALLAEPKLDILNVTGDITFSNVSYTDHSSGRQILNNINLTIKSGEFIGIIGESGAGKSTLFKLLLGLENLSAGRITLDNINTDHIDSRALRKQFGVVLQNSNVFPGSILSNLSTNKTLSLDEAWQLAEAVGLAEDIQRMPMKMHTYISDNAGESISGGQKQKILLARAIASKPRILLLDEATSALDASSQAVIYRFLETLNITRIVIAHRANTLKGADKIYLLQDGKLTEPRP